MLPNQSYNDKQLLSRIVDGDEAAMSSVFKAYFGKLVLYAKTMVTQQAEAEDVAMNALTKLWQNRNPPQQITSLSGFLYRVVHNLCIDHIRHEQVKSKRQQDLMALETNAEDYIESHYLRVELVKFIYEEMDKLPDKCREVVKLYFIHGCSHAEIAKKMNIEEKTVRNQKARALGLIKTALIKKKLLFTFYAIF